MVITTAVKKAPKAVINLTALIATTISLKTKSMIPLFEDAKPNLLHFK